MVFEERTMKSTRAFEGKVLSVRVDTIELPNQRYAKREIVERANAVGIVAIDEKGDLILVRQFRKAAERVLLEIPAGMIEPSEEPRETARRELREETGYTAKKISYITEFYATPGFCNEKMTLFLAEDLKEGVQDLDEGENVEVIKMSLTDALRAIAAGDIIDAKSIVGILSYETYWRRNND